MQDESKGIQVICAGLGRTGTLSLTLALQELGYRPYHFVDFAHAAAWADLARHPDDAKRIDDMIDSIVQDGYTATLENPTSDIYQDILRRYPSAKVILTVRDTPAAFEQSWKTLFNTMVVTEQDFSWTFPSFFQWIPLFRHLKQTRQFMGTTHLALPPAALTHGWRGSPGGWLAEQYERHNQHVQTHVPSDQLLVFNVKQGWAPLCEFLGKPVPADTPFPHSKVNDAKALRELKQTFLIAVYAWIPLVIVSTATCVGGALWLRGRYNSQGTRTKSR